MMDKTYEELESENKSLRHILQVWKDREAENKELRKTIDELNLILSSTENANEVIQAQLDAQETISEIQAMALDDAKVFHRFDAAAEPRCCSLLERIGRMKPEARKRLKQQIDMVVKSVQYTKGGDGAHWTGCEDIHWDCKINKLEDENKKLVDEYGKLSETWQIEHAEKLTLIEKLKFAEERIKYLRATIMNEIEDEPSPSDVSVTQDVLIDIKKPAEIKKG